MGRHHGRRVDLGDVCILGKTNGSGASVTLLAHDEYSEIEYSQSCSIRAPLRQAGDEELIAMWPTGVFSVGEVLLRMRKNAQLTQAELAARLGWPSSKVCGIELSGRIRPDELLAFAGAIGIDPRSLFDEVLDALLGVPQRKRSQDTSASRQRVRLAQRYVAEILRDRRSS